MASTVHKQEAADQPPPESTDEGRTVQICDASLLYSYAEQDARERNGDPYAQRIGGRKAIGHAACSHADPACSREVWRLAGDGYHTVGHCAVIAQMSHMQGATPATTAWHVQSEAPHA